MTGRGGGSAGIAVDVAAELAVVLTAVGLDEALAELPTRLHPVVAMGAYLHRAGRLVPATPPARAVLLGGLAWGCGLVASVAVATAVDRASAHLPRPLAVSVQAAALSTLLSARLLRTEVAQVEQQLARSLPEGRRQVARLVSRDTRSLSPEQVRAAALGSLSENLCDSVAAPLFAYGVGGLPAAAGYRFANTADAMWGYRTPRWRHAGRVAARADDLANLLPARLTGLLLLRPWSGASLSGLREQARGVPSPNGGWPMGALAVRLGVRMAKPGVYELNPDGRAPVAADTVAALRLARGLLLPLLVVTGLLIAARRCLR